MNRLQNMQFDTVVTWFMDIGVDIVIAIIVGTLVYYVGKKLLARIILQLIKSAKHRNWHKKDVEKRQKTLVQIFATIWRLVVIFSVTYAILRAIFGDTITNTFAPLFASAGIIGIALGIGAQSLIKDFLSGVFIITENQYRVGDIVDIEGFGGTVERIGARSTVIRDVDGNVHYFPNGMVQHVINKTMGYSMARFTVSVHPSSDIGEVSELIEATGKKLSEEEIWKHKILEAPSIVAVGEFNANSVDLIVAGKTQPSDQWSVISEMRLRLLDAFEEKNIELAVPLLSSAMPTKK